MNCGTQPATLKHVSRVEDLRLRWLSRLTHLRVDVDRRRGKAPHKALLLLSVLDQIEGGELEAGRVRRSDPRLVFRFQTYWSIVVAAHIHAFASSRNDDPRNGLALTPNVHWTFDEGLWTAVPEGRDRFRMRVARRAFSESAVGGMALGDLDGRFLHFAPGVALRPDPKHFAWHREHIFGQSVSAS